MHTKQQKDTLYQKFTPKVPTFKFDETVAAVFPDMIQRSVPGYSTVIQLIGNLAAQIVQANTFVYDLGCSLGTATVAIRSHIKQTGVKIIAIDRSMAMLKRAKQLLTLDSDPIETHLICADILAMPLQNTSYVVLNYCLQFIPIEQRTMLLKKIFHKLTPNGALLLSEKISFQNPIEQNTMTQLHHQFKQTQGYSQLEISQKHQALENVLITETQEEHIKRLKSVGFNHVYPLSQSLNFITLIAYKQPSV